MFYFIFKLSWIENIWKISGKMPKRLQKSVGPIIEWEVAIFSGLLLFLWYIFRAKNIGLTETIEIVSVTQPPEDLIFPTAKKNYVRVVASIMY